jgi:hypothetical protein
MPITRVHFFLFFFLAEINNMANVFIFKGTGNIVRGRGWECEKTRTLEANFGQIMVLF